jgi:hypothetical protein
LLDFWIFGLAALLPAAVLDFGMMGLLKYHAIHFSNNPT